MLSWFILAPLAGVVLLNLPLAALLRKQAFALAMLLAVAQLAAVLVAMFTIYPIARMGQSGPFERFLALNLTVDRLSIVMLLAVSITLCAVVLVGMATIREPARACNFVSLLLLAMAGMNGAVLVTDLFSLYVFLEVTSIASFVLIAFNRDANALEGAFKYVLLSAVATLLMLSGVALLLMAAGSTDFARVAAALRSADRAGLAQLGIAAFLCGLFIKGGLVPFHGWVLGAYSAAPAAASVLLAGIGTKVSGIYALIRLADSVFPHSDGLSQVLMLIGAISIVVGALAALGQKDMKRMLAYSSISQVGYIILGLGCATPLGVAAAIFHLFNHCVFKSLLFVNSAALEQQVGTTDMRRMGGLGSRMPITSATSVIASLSTAGVPPFSGFWSKVLIVVALWQAGHWNYAALAIALSLLTLAYFLVLQRRVFFGKLLDTLGGVHEAGWQLTLACVVLAAVTLGLGLLIPLLWNTALLPTGGIF